MKKLEINTTQNVTIEYELAAVGSRIGAFAIDMLIVVTFSSILGALFSSYNNITIGTIVSLPILLYNLISEMVTNGQSIGKKAMGIKVIKLNGESLRAFDFLTRWVFRIVDIGFSLGIIAIVMITSTARAQRLGDMVGDMVVIRTGSSDIYNLRRILNRKKDRDYEPVYPQASIFTEDEMLIVKQTVTRYQKYKNEGHKEAILLLSKKIAEQLQVTVPQNKIQFLNQVIKDYVHLTR